MSYTIQKLPEEPIVVFRAAANYNVQTEIQSVVRDSLALFETLEETVFLIVDFSLASLDMQDIMVGTSAAAQGEASPFQHPRVRQPVFVTRSPALKMTADGLSNIAFGELYVPVFENHEDALAYVRAELE